ncbi:hypothetical protein LOZ53_003833 [Ophidiomyces ophidiicola]|uniref:Uncharacterized protein n=1 Tax=Ophidiomyces ophidiicola TaxID=1387563 RepID=A0ACB8V1G9_9EURO|nr:hypothetical protein LOZ64_005241 [Ophidiomyces ophidiicola]KAI1914877.1 hypothetical protein LOZ61_002014 [Ophidiomyces ophidiicola]KAI1924795.1 hypothetical protein LOZ60_004527 [Ophidiomyces ophidiicola]KAI1953182.1 hypothetical protein LOZ59_005224 [Ophidiomyces ophidiicola]KAI1953502.1 hypothetical protein LOZ62_001059 [Ophidiomyces ophidiicola]
MPHHIQSPGSMLPSSASLLNRDNGYSSLPYSMSRNFSVPQTTNTFTDTSRYHQYETRSNDVTMTNTPTAVYGSSNGLYLESPSRLPPPNADSPPWLETETYHRITGNGQSVKPEIQARIHKGFFPAGGYWTCYRRNYFSVSLSFAMKPWLGYVSYLLHRPGRAPEKILSFAMRLSASVNGQEKETRELIQHTPKRDKQSESKPKQATLQPQPPPSLLINHSNNPSINFATPPSQSAGMQMDYSSSYGGAQQSSQTPTFHTWERIQFQKATANNGKRRAQQQFYNLAAELWAEIADPHGNGAEWILLAKRLSNPVVVRGRSPGHYKDAKRDSASRNGDTDPGASVLSRPGIHNGINMTHSRSQIPSVYDPIPRNNSQYDYRRMPSTDQSPLTASSLVSSSSSSPGYDSMLNDSLNPMQPITHTSSIDGYGQPAYASASAPRRVAVEPMSTRCVLPSFGDTTKAHDHNDMSLGEAFDPMIPMMNSDHGGPGHYLRAQPNGYVNHEVSRPPSGGRFNSYSTRPEDHTYGRYDTMPNSHIM